MQDDQPTLPVESTEIEREAAPGVLDLIALYEPIEDTYIKASDATARVEVHMVTGNSTNVAQHRGA